MIYKVTLKEKKDVKLPKDIHAGYEFGLESLKGKTFTFKPGLNVIVGKNGCGKTSLLNIIRKITFCDNLFYSSAAVGRQYWQLHAKQNYENGYWHLADVKAQFSASTFNLRKPEDMHGQDFCDSYLNFAQTFRQSNRSKGENLMDSIKMMTIIHRFGEEYLESKGEKPKRDEKGFLPFYYFKNTVINPIEKELKCSNEFWVDMWNKMLSYYKENNISTDDSIKDYRGFTFLMDEPDSGMDIFNIEEVFGLLDDCPPHYQHITVLHNVAMIHKLKKTGKVNFIELTPGYVDEVEKFLG